MACVTAFEYQALDARGRTRQGVLEGDNARQARQRLRHQGLIPLRVEAVGDTRRRRRLTLGGDRLGGRELALLTRQLATLVKSGLPVAEALEMAARQSASQRGRRILAAVRTRVLEGHSLADGLAGFPGVFPPLYRATVTAGEHAGRLAEVLQRLADYTERRHALQRRLVTALFYPALLTLVAIVVVAALLAYVVPQVVQVFDSIDADLPWLTRALISLSELTQAWGWLVLIALVAGTTAWALLLRLPGPRLWWHGTLLRVPLAGKLHATAQISRFSRTLSILVRSGVGLLDALTISAGVLDNRVLRGAVQRAAARVREGTPLHLALERERYFPPLLVHFIASGEAGGNLDEMLEHATDMQESDLEALLTTGVALFEPLLILVMGGIVLAIVIAILLPVFELNRLVQ